MSIYVHVRNLIHNPFPKLLTQCENALVFARHLALCELTGSSKPYNAGYVKGAAPHSTLVTSAVHHRNKHYPRVLAPDVQTSNPLRSVDLVSGERCEIHIKIVNIERNLADCLGSISMEYHTFLFTYFSDFGDRLNHADLIIGHHNCDQNCFIGDGILDIVRGDQPV